MVVLFLRHKYTIQGHHTSSSGSANYCGDADLIRTPNGCFQRKKIVVQCNSNHAWPSNNFQHPPSFWRMSLGRTVQSNNTSQSCGQFRQTMVLFRIKKVENWPSFACFNFCGPIDHKINNQRTVRRSKIIVNKANTSTQLIQCPPLCL